MPWKASSVMEEKVRFVVEYEQDHYNMTELCQRYGIARETGYVWLRLYRERGLEGGSREDSRVNSDGSMHPQTFTFSYRQGSDNHPLRHQE